MNRSTRARTGVGSGTGAQKGAGGKNSTDTMVFLLAGIFSDWKLCAAEWA